MTARNYLLGRLSEEEAEKLETRVIEEENTFYEVRDAEADLFDEYARGELSESDRVAFIAKYGADPRVSFATALAKRPGKSRRLLVWSALAAAAAAAFAIVMVNRPADPASDVPSQTVTFRPVAAVAPVIATLTLETSRAAQAPQQIAIPPAAQSVEIRVPLHPEDQFARYRAEVTSGSGAVHRIDGVAPGAGNVLPLLIPAERLAAGSYELAVYGDDEPLGFVTFEVRRP